MWGWVGLLVGGGLLQCGAGWGDGMNLSSLRELDESAWVVVFALQLRRLHSGACTFACTLATPPSLPLVYVRFFVSSPAPVVRLTTQSEANVDPMSNVYRKAEGPHSKCSK